MTPIKFDVTYLVGGEEFGARPYAPYSALQCQFLDALSSELRADHEARAFPDVIAFAFWCRKGHVMKLQEKFASAELRLGLGNVFHIAPGNVPVNFAFTYVFGLLAGNSNFVRLPSKPFPQVDIICRALKSILARDEFRDIRPLTHMFRYDHASRCTADLSAQCQARVIWGGDATIRSIRQFPITERGVDIAFADRYSMSCMGAKSLLSIAEKDLETLANGFYNDTYLMDQNACSSPHLIVWLGKGSDVDAAKEKFWGKVHDLVRRKYSLSFKAAVDKHVLLCQQAIELEGVTNAAAADPWIYRMELRDLPANIDESRGQCGYFYEYSTTDLHSVAHVVNAKYQTLTYYGISKNELSDFVVSNRLSGIDRIVPVGSALDMSTTWDGVDVIRSLSRIIDVH